MLVMHSIDKTPKLEVQVRHASESFEDKTGEAPTTLRCHPTDAALFAGVALKVIPILISKNVYWIGNE